MTAPVLTFHDSADLPVAPPLSLPPGGPPFEVRIYNNIGGTGADPARGLWGYGLARLQGSATWLGTGLDLLDQRQIEARVVGGSGATQWTPTGWQPVVGGARLALPDVPNAAAVHVELRAAAAAAAAPAAYEVAFRVTSARSTWIGREHADGIVLGRGDSATSALAWRGGTITPTSPASATVDLPAVHYVHRGDVHELAAAPLPLDDLDGAAVQLAAGEGYVAALTLGASGLTVTRGAKDVLPLTEADRPALVEGEILWAWVERDFDAAIDAADVDEVAEVGYLWAEASGLVLRLGPGVGHVDGYEVRTTFGQDVPLPPSSTSAVWLVADGSIVTTSDGSRPTGRPILLWVAETDAAAVVGLEDRRTFADGVGLAAW